MAVQKYHHQWFQGDAFGHFSSIGLSPAIGLSCSKIVCVGRNYADHIAELQSPTPSQPVLFLKPPSALVDANQDIDATKHQHLGVMHHELEIALLIGTQLKADSKNPTSAICGIGLGIDLTLRGLQSALKGEGLPWERAKAFDGSCSLSPFIPFSSNAENDSLSRNLDLDDLTITLHLNGRLQQQGNSSMMLNSIPELLANIIEVFTLEPGDVVLTGTPAGVGPLTEGDSLSAQLNNCQLIENTSVI